jgi:hypothetical protein
MLGTNWTRSTLASDCVCHLREYFFLVTDDPKIIFRDGPTGLRAALDRGPDVWELVATLGQFENQDAEAIWKTAELLHLTVPQVNVAIRYYSEYPDEIDERIRRNAEDPPQ